MKIPIFVFTLAVIAGSGFMEAAESPFGATSQLKWQTNFVTFIEQFDNQVKSAPTNSLSSVFDADYSNKTVKWKLKFLGVTQGKQRGAPSFVKFDLVPFYGRQPDFLDRSPRSVLPSFRLDEITLQQWQKLAPGTPTEFEATIVGILFNRMKVTDKTGNSGTEANSGLVALGNLKILKAD